MNFHLKKILIAEDEPDLLEIYSMVVEASLLTPVIAVASGNAAINELKKNGGKDIAAVISDYRMANGNGDIIYSYIKENNIDVPFILVTGSPEVLEQTETFKNFIHNDERNAFIPKPCSAEEIVSVVSATLKASVDVASDFTMLNASRLLRYNTLPIDIFLKIHDTKYVKIINKNELYNSEIIEKYLSKGINFFYIKAIDFKLFAEYHMAELKKAIFITNLPEEEKVELQIEISSYVRDYIKMFGLDMKMVETVHQVANSTILLVKSNPNLFSLLQKMLNSRSEYIAAHSLLISYVACDISTRLGWFTDSTYQKLCFAAMLHDITLESDLAKIQTNTDMRSIKSVHDLKEIKTHPYKIAEMVRELKNVPPDVDSIIFSHHERPDGSGFPRALTSNVISPLSCIFILAEEFVNRTMNSEKTEIDRAQEIEYFSGLFKHGNFKRPLEGLIGILS